MNESLFRKAIAKLVKPHEVVMPTNAMSDVLSAFKCVLKREVDPDAALLQDVAMDSVDLLEVTIVLDEVYGERDWEPLWDQTKTRFIFNEHPALTARMIAKFLELPAPHTAERH